MNHMKKKKSKSLGMVLNVLILGHIGFQRIIKPTKGVCGSKKCHFSSTDMIHVIRCNLVWINFGENTFFKFFFYLVFPVVLFNCILVGNVKLVNPHLIHFIVSQQKQWSKISEIASNFTSFPRYFNCKNEIQMY